MQRLVDLTIVPGGLQISVVAEGLRVMAEAVKEIAEIAAKAIDADSKLAEVLEWNLCNSEWEFITPEECGALTSAPMLTNDCRRDSHGEILEIGHVYAYMDYQVHDPVQWLLDHGQVFFRGDEVVNRGDTQSPETCAILLAVMQDLASQFNPRLSELGYPDVIVVDRINTRLKNHQRVFLGTRTSMILFLEAEGYNEDQLDEARIAWREISKQKRA